MTIYKITNKKTDDFYIGKTTQTLLKRWYQHCKNAEYGHKSYLYHAIRKYGKDNFTIEFVCEGSDKEEIEAIRLMNPSYNLTQGGTGGDTSKSVNYKKAILLRDQTGSKNGMFGLRGKNNPNYGKKRTIEQIEKIKRTRERKPVIINSVHYESILQATKVLNRSARYVRRHDETTVSFYRKI